MEELKRKLDELFRTVNELKTTNDARIEKIEKGLPVGSDRDEKIAKIQGGLDGLIDTVNNLKTAMNRAPAATEVEAKDEKSKAGKKALETYILGGGMNAAGRKALYDALPESYRNLPEAKALSTDSDPAGGYLVRPELESEIMKQVSEMSPVRQVADVRTIGSKKLEQLVRTTRAGSVWVGERQTRSETSDPVFEEQSWETHEMAAMPAVYQWEIEDAFVDVEGFLKDEVQEDFAIGEGTAFVSGDGIKKPRGFLSYTAGSTWGTVEQVNSGHASTLTATGLFNLQDALFERFQPNAIWAMRRASRTAIRLMTDAEGKYLWSVEGNLNSGVQEVLLGKRIQLMSDMPAVEAGALAVAYGDFKQAYRIVDRVGISVIRDNVTVKGKVLLYTRKRVGGGMKNFQALKIQKVAA